MEDKRTHEFSEASTALLLGVAGSQFARRAAFHSRRAYGRRLSGVLSVANKDRAESKNLYFPCRFWSSSGKYVVEDMEDSIYRKYGIDPNRAPTDAEVELVAFCFDVGLEEARSILSHRILRTGAPQEDFVNNHETRQEVWPGSSVANNNRV